MRIVLHFLRHYLNNVLIYHNYQE